MCLHRQSGAGEKLITPPFSPPAPPLPCAPGHKSQPLCDVKLGSLGNRTPNSALRFLLWPWWCGRRAAGRPGSSSSTWQPRGGGGAAGKTGTTMALPLLPGNSFNRNVSGGGPVRTAFRGLLVVSLSPLTAPAELSCRMHLPCVNTPHPSPPPFRIYES